MQHLPLPCVDDDDDAVVKRLCKADPWLPHEETWLEAYKAYRDARSNPWVVAPAGFDPDISEPQYDLYDKRKRGGPIKRIRDTAGLLSCPVCGSPTTGSLDHLLPRAVYPEFSIMRANLVPACLHCNSAAKGNKHRGDEEPERFIHPYFDRFQTQPIWSVRINPPYAAATFDAVPLPTLGEKTAAIVRYHLRHVLGGEFTRRMETTWSTLPGSLQAAAAGAPITVPSIAAILATDLTRAIRTRGENSWDAALLRGLSANADAIAYMAAKTVLYPN